MSLKLEKIKNYQTHGSGEFDVKDFSSIGENVVFEKGVSVFHAANIKIGNNVYFGHNSIVKGYHKNTIEIGDNTWIGQDCFFHGAGGLKIGRAVGVGPKVSIITSAHTDKALDLPVLYQDIEFKPVVLEDGCDIGVGAIILPGVIIGEGAIVGAGSVVTRNVDPYTVVAGNPAKILRSRK